MENLPVSAPCVLLVGLMPGFGGMHLPRHLARVGLRVAFLGTRACMASSSGFVEAFLPWEPENGGHYQVAPFAKAVRHCRPVCLVPIDECAAELLQIMGRGTTGQEAAFTLPGDIAALVRNSLGNPDHYPLASARQRAYQTSRTADIPVPEQADVSTQGEIIDFARRHQWRIVVKRERSMGGVGIHILDSEAATREFVAQGLFLASGGKWVAQAFMPGRLGMHAVFAVRGHVLAAVSAIQLLRRSENASAPSSVVMLCGHKAMAASGAAFVEATGASGFHGWDFQVDEGGNAFLIEHNPRPISISHLGGLLGSDLMAALAASCGVRVPPPPHPPMDECRVTLFPDEWRRDAASPWLHGQFHDVPWYDPALLGSVMAANFSYR